MNEDTTPSTRRSFLKSAAATGAAAWISPSLAWAEANAASQNIEMLNAAVIGCGGMSSFHAKHHLKPWFHVKAICDVDQQRLDAYRSLVPEAETFSRDHRELLNRDDIDVFIVCTPDHWHAQITVDALRHKKDVYCEKPLTFSVDEGRLIEKTLHETQRTLQVGTQQRSDVNFQTAVGLARSGRIGKVKRITTAIGGGPEGGPFESQPVPKSLDWDRWLGQAPLTDYIPQRCHGNFRWWYEYSGGKLTDWGAHHVDIALWALGDAVSKTVSIEVKKSVHPVEFKKGFPTATNQYNTANSFEILCRFQDGTELVIRDQALDLGFENGILFECEEGRYFVNRGKLTGGPVEALKTDPLPESLFEQLRKEKPTMSHMENFYRSCLDKSDTISDAGSHIRHLNFCHLANIAQRLETDLVWDIEKQQVINHEVANEWCRREQRAGYQVQ